MSFQSSDFKISPDVMKTASLNATRKYYMTIYLTKVLIFFLNIRFKMNLKMLLIKFVLNIVDYNTIFQK